MNDVISNSIFDETVEYENPEDLLDAVSPSYADSKVFPQSYFPENYVVYYTGPRGSSKTLQLARHALMGLEAGINVFTNLELYPEKADITNQPKPLNLEFLLSFDESLTDAIIAASEIDTMFDRFREASTGNRLGGKFFQQLRKKGLRVFLDTQDFLPGSLMRQVDKLVYCNDFCFTQWGKDRNLPKGTTFYYDCYDYSGIFTGFRGYHWREVLYHAERVWPLFNTNKIHDPYGFAGHTKVIGMDREYNQDTGEMYLTAEKDQRQWEANRKANAKILSRLIASYKATGFIDLIRAHNGVEELNDRIVFSTDKVRKALGSISEQERMVMEPVYDEIQELAGQQQYAHFRSSGQLIELATPNIVEGSSEN